MADIDFTPEDEQRPQIDFTPEESRQETPPQPSRFPSAYIPPDTEKEVTQKFDESHSILGAAAQAIGDIAGGIPQMVAQLPRMAYEGAQFAALPSERPRILGEVVPQAIEQGQQMAADVGAPLGTRESFRGLANVGLMALPALGEAGGLSRVLFGRGAIEPPPIQTTPLRDVLFGRENPTVTAATESVVEPTIKPTSEPTKIGETNAIQPSNAQVEAGTIAQRIEAGTEGNVPTTGRSDNVVGEAQGTEARGEISARQGTEAQVAPPQTTDVTEPTTAQPATAETPTPPTEKPPISTKSVYTEQARSERGIPAAEQSARRDFGTVWDEAGQVLEKDPNAAHRLVADVNEGKAKATTDLENALLLRRQISAQEEYSDAVDAVNSARTETDKTVAQSRLMQARDDLQQVYDADKKAGTVTGRGLNARRMLANEDYSIARMEASRRAANKGEPLSDVQLKEVKDHYDAISRQESRIKSAEDALGSSRQPLDPKEILNGIERMKARIAPCL